jgi:hypothetical protein
LGPFEALAISFQLSARLRQELATIPIGRIGVDMILIARRTFPLAT